MKRLAFLGLFGTLGVGAWKLFLKTPLTPIPDCHFALLDKLGLSAYIPDFVSSGADMLWQHLPFWAGGAPGAAAATGSAAGPAGMAAAAGGAGAAEAIARAAAIGASGGVAGNMI